MELSPAQIRFFKSFGYLYFPQLFAPDEIAWITEEFERSIQAYGNGAQHDGSKRTMFGGPIEHRERLCTLVDDERIVGICNGVLGENFNYASGDGNYYSGDTGWHPDGNWGQLFSVKIAFYLDDLTRDTGCLRIIPGSHHPNHFVRAEGIDLNNSVELFGIEPRDFPGSLALETTPGDLVIFNHDLYHASFGGDQRRRMFTMNLTRPCTSDADLATLRDYLSRHSPGGYQVVTGGGMFYPTMLNTASPERMVHLRQCAEVHDELFPELARH